MPKIFNIGDYLPLPKRLKELSDEYDEARKGVEGGRPINEIEDELTDELINFWLKYDPDMALEFSHRISQHFYPEPKCAGCQQILEGTPAWTDGQKYFCEECGPHLYGVYKRNK